MKISFRLIINFSKCCVVQIHNHSMGFLDDIYIYGVNVKIAYWDMTQSYNIYLFI